MPPQPPSGRPVTPDIPFILLILRTLIVTINARNIGFRLAHPGALDTRLIISIILQSTRLLDA